MYIGFNGLDTIPKEDAFIQLVSELDELPVIANDMLDGTEYAQVEDQDGDCFYINTDRLELVE